MSNCSITVLQEPSEENPFVVIYKPSHLATAPLQEGEDCALTQAVQLFPQIKQVKGKKQIEYGLMHRLDTETEGLLLIATTQSAYDALWKSQTLGNFVKSYHAFCDALTPKSEDAFPPCPIALSVKDSPQTVCLTSRFRAYGKGARQVRPVIEESGKYQKKKASDKVYTTKITLFQSALGIEAECSISSGYRHQVRCHLAWLGFPVQNDKLYNSLAGETTKELKFKASAFSFPHPLTQETLFFKA